MSGSFTVNVLKENNKKLILRYLYKQKKATPLMIQKGTGLSRPTTAQILKELIQDETLQISGLADSTGGRKANLYEFDSLKKISIGVEIVADHYELSAVDLYGELLKYEKRWQSFSMEESYIENVCSGIKQFIDSLEGCNEQILGVGIAIQALISSDGRHIIYGKILDCDGLDITEFSKRIPYPCKFNHDAESVANVELWKQPSLKNAIYFNVREDVSGAMIINRKFFQDGPYKSGIFEHMTIVPNGRPCYCGKKGCVNSYCSLRGLLKTQEDIQSFFTKLRNGSQTHQKRWIKYLKYWAVAIDNLHMTINSHIILGGLLSHYLIEEDIVYLHQLVKEVSAFPVAEQFIEISRSGTFPTCIGAALPYIQEYLEILMK